MQLPDWFRAHRPHQLAAIDEIVDAYRSGANVVVVDAPTGAGKTLIAETVRQRLGLSALYTCSTKSLQDQFTRDYPYAKLLKGRSNYATELYPERFARGWDSLSCEDCTKSITVDRSCKWCASVDTCPYEGAKKEALQSGLAVLNTSYLLHEANYVGGFSGRGLVIADECDLLDAAICDFVTVEISEKRMAALGIEAPKKVTVEESWKEWVEQTEPMVKHAAKEAREQARRTSKPRDVREANYLSSLCKKVGDLDRGLAEGGWVYTGNRDRVQFKPVWPHSVAQEALWRHGRKWLLMSATVINAESLLSSLGYDNSSYMVSVPSTFPAANRPIYVRPVANMSAKEKESEWPKLPPAIHDILDKHPNERVLIHTVSYDLTKYLVERHTSSRPLVTYTTAGDRDNALSKFLSLDGAVLYAPSLDRGIDLPGDACRVQVVVKCPFPYLGDKQVSKRLYSPGGQLHYTVETIRTLVQMCGRAVRSEDDWAATYILDRNFELRLWGRNRKLFPAWFREALVWKN